MLESMQLQYSSSKSTRGSLNTSFITEINHINQCIYRETTIRQQAINMVCWFMVFNATFNNISVISWQSISFIGGGNRSTRRKPPTCHKSLTNFMTYYYAFCNISSYDILAYITKNYIALIYYFMRKQYIYYASFTWGRLGFQLSVKLYIASPRARGWIQSVNLSQLSIIHVTVF